MSGDNTEKEQAGPSLPHAILDDLLGLMDALHETPADKKRSLEEHARRQHQAEPEAVASTPAATAIPAVSPMGKQPSRGETTARTRQAGPRPAKSDAASRRAAAKVIAPPSQVDPAPPVSTAPDTAVPDAAGNSGVSAVVEGMVDADHGPLVEAEAEPDVATAPSSFFSAAVADSKAEHEELRLWDEDPWSLDVEPMADVEDPVEFDDVAPGEFPLIEAVDSFSHDISTRGSNRSADETDDIALTGVGLDAEQVGTELEFDEPEVDDLDHEGDDFELEILDGDEAELDGDEAGFAGAELDGNEAELDGDEAGFAGAELDGDEAEPDGDELVDGELDGGESELDGEEAGFAGAELDGDEAEPDGDELVDGELEDDETEEDELEVGETELGEVQYVALEVGDDGGELDEPPLPDGWEWVYEDEVDDELESELSVVQDEDAESEVELELEDGDSDPDAELELELEDGDSAADAELELELELEDGDSDPESDDAEFEDAESEDAESEHAEEDGVDDDEPETGLSLPDDWGWDGEDTTSGTGSSRTWFAQNWPFVLAALFIALGVALIIIVVIRGQ